MIRRRKQGWKALTFLFLAALLLCPFGVLADENPVIHIHVLIDWDNVPDEQVPSEMLVTFIPDGVPFMAANLQFGRDIGWEGSVEAIAGTRTLQIHVDPLPDLEYRLLGDVASGYVLQYFPAGEIPDDGAEEADQSVNPLAAEHEIAGTRQVAVSEGADVAPLPQISTEPGESLSQEEYEQRLYEAALAEQGITEVSRTKYMIAVIICVVLIIIVVIARILLGRK